MAAGSVVEPLFAPPDQRQESSAEPSFSARLARVLAECRALSAEHRLAFPASAVYRRIHELCGLVRPMFQDWTMEICFLLDHHGVLRYGHLRRHLEGISTRTLATKLVQLQEMGLVRRTFYDEVPPHVDYRLTEHGREFTAVVLPMFAHLARRGGE